MLEADLTASQQFPSDYESDLESKWSRRSAEEDLNVFDQEDLSSRVSKQMSDVSSLLNSALKIHLNVQQQFTINTFNLFMSFQSLNIESLRGKEIPSVGEARLRLPSSRNLSLDDEHQTGSLKVRSSPSPSM